MMFKSAVVRSITLPVVLLGMASCTNMGTLGDVLTSAGPYGTPRELSGQVRSIDTRQQEIRLETGWGRSERVRYDGRTQVVYGQRRYSVRDLERGDQVWMTVDGRSGRLYTRYIEVQRGVVSRPGRIDSGRRVQRIEGSVMLVDVRRGYFDVDQGRGSVVTVTLPQNASRATRDRLNRLRRGERIRVEAQTINTWTVELLRFL